MGLLSRGSAVVESEPQAAPVVDAPSIPTSAAAFPRVNLMPDEIAEEARIRRAKLVLAGAAVVSVGAVGALFMMAGAEVSSAQESLDQAAARGTVLAAEVAQYSDVPAARADLASAQAQQYLAMGGEVRWSFLLNNLSLTLPRGTSLTEFKGLINGLAPTPGAAGAATGTNAASGQASILGKPAIGEIQYAGEARGYTDVAALLDVFAKQKTLVDPYPGTVQSAEAVTTGVSAGTTASPGKGYTFTATSSVSDKSLSHRYDIKDGG
jgi:Tfp pilus assembly protein PilN